LPAVAEVAVLAPVEGLFSYALPEHFSELQLRPGQRVLVPFGRRTLTGILMRITPASQMQPDPEAAAATAPPASKTPVLKPLVELLDLEPLIPAEILKLARFAAEYYLYPIGEVLRAAMPPGLAMRGARWLHPGERFTEALAEALAGGSPDPGRELLEKIASAGRLRVGGRHGISPQLVQPLLRAGAVRLEDQLEGVRRGPSLAPTHLRLRLSLAEAVAALRRAPAQRALVAWVAARGRVNRVELSAAFKGASASIRKLVEREILEEAQGSAEESPGLGPLPEGEDQRKEAAPLGEASAQAAKATGAREGGGLRLSAEQAEIVAAASEALKGGYSAHLIEGVTGSGKTEIYLRVIQEALAAGKGALVLVPEISLTPQLVGRFQDRFGDAVALLHSGRSDAERRRDWGRLLRGSARIAVGVRSAVFAPVPDLGVIVVDEEHDGSFKQDDGLCYHARDLAIVRARQSQVPVLLGSATPSLETLANAARGRFVHHHLRKRVEDRPLPSIELVDLKLHAPPRDGGGHGALDGPDQAQRLLSAPLVVALRQTLASKQQAILFLNRRGQAPALVCAECGAPHRCPNCEVSLTRHRSPPHLLCHYCGLETKVARRCQSCDGALFLAGAGTQALEEEVAEQVPGARVLRLDRDATTKRGAMAEKLACFARHDYDVMVGTQMVAKGHDFPGVTLVGVVLADQGLWLPDLRAAEHNVQVLSQVAGRAGRGKDPGRVMIQTYQPNNPAIQAVAAGDYEAFAAAELLARETGRWPPHQRLLLVRIHGGDASQVERVAAKLARRAEVAVVASPEAGVEILGPAPSPLSRLRGKTRWQLLFRAPSVKALAWIGGVVREAKLPRGLTVQLDMDPISML